MSDSFPTIINITATSIVLRLPELMELIGQHLSVPTLFYSVCRTDTPEKRAERQVIEQFWALVQQNPGLVRVRTPSLEEMNSLSETFILSTLKSLEYLRDLGMDDSQSRMWTLFRSLPKLERWDKYIRGDTLWNWKPKERFTNLRSLSLRFYVLVGEIFRILEYLPNVEELRIGGTPSQSMEYAMIMKRELPLKVLHVDKVLHYEDRFVAVLVRQCPQLLHFRSREVLKMTRQALWENCYSLESIDSARHVSVIPWRQRRLEDARRKQAQ
ncbi:hypothetical protein EC991_001146 [Linnemannia zychae]|nr:hypothetical protein EC991_001146 [Linnemannia zychae]